MMHGDKKWVWCKFHTRWGQHTAEKCQLNLKNKTDKRSNNKGSDKSSVSGNEREQEQEN